ncbi:MAG: tetratricopeptide repeat protein [Promethearchaeota archaeon]
MNNSNDIANLIQKAKLLKDQENFEKALEILNELYEKFPESEDIKKNLIDTLFLYGGYLNDDYTLEYEKAKSIFERIINLSSKNYRAHYNLGIAYFNLKDLKNSKKCFNKALRIKPDYKYCFYNLGLIYESLKKYEKALKYYELALEIDPDFTYALSAQNQLRKKIDNIKRIDTK